MAKKDSTAGTSSMAKSRKTGATIKSAESRRMGGLANIPTVERREQAVKRLLDRAR